MILTEPTIEYGPQIAAYRREFLDSGDSMDGTGPLRRFEDPQDWINETVRYKDPLTVPEGRVPATQYIYVREEDRKIVGMIQIRHYFNDYLEKFGGHIGYSVAPGERRKGYAEQMLKEALPKCRELGLKKVLITCTKGNEGSRKTILKNGGVYESTVYDDVQEKEYIERYWITLNTARAAEKWKMFREAGSRKRKRLLDHTFEFCIDDVGSGWEYIHFELDGRSTGTYRVSYIGPDVHAFVNAVTGLKEKDFMEFTFLDEPGQYDLLFSKRQENIYIELDGFEDGFFLRYNYFTEKITEGLHRCYR